jgi:biopolymer transport protein ExbB/TolQ
VGFYFGVQEYAGEGSLIWRYTAGHWVEYVETGMFFWALVALAAKAWDLRRQRAIARHRHLPVWNGEPVPASEAGKLAGQLARHQASGLLVDRLRGALEFVHSRGSTEGLDDHLRAQSDADANTVDGSYALIRYITWAIPILGFLGTVLGITEAIANVTPEQLANSISSVTGGLAIAFDTTAIALGYSMALMFFTFVLDRREQALLGEIDALVDEEVAHRFERTGGEGNEVIELIRRNHQTLLQGIEQLVKRQTELWAQSLDAMRVRFEQANREQQERVTASLGRLLDQTLTSHQQRLTVQEKKADQQASESLKHAEQIAKHLHETAGLVERQSAKAAEQSAVLGQLLESERQLLRLQETLQQNLQTLAHAGGFQQALHSLTAAIHLLTARSEAPPAFAASTLATRTRQGNAA